MNWIFTSLHWYIYILIIGIVFLPMTRRLFSRFSFDFGYPFSKAIAVIIISYSAYILGLLKLVPFSRMSLFAIIGIFALINWYILSRSKNKSGKLTVKRGKLAVFIFEEILFLVSFLFWTYIRSQEPSVRSLEKFMDFGFMNSILRSEFFPPRDIWYAPEPINYYYFGHLGGAIMIKISNIIPSIGYNLILSTLFAQGVTQVFSMVTNIITFYTKKIKKISLFIFGLFAAFIVNLGGNLHTIYVFTKGYPNEDPVPFWKIFSEFSPLTYWYPNATRFIQNTIHEFPSYSYVVADLHGHVFDIPFVMLSLALLFLFFTSKKNLETGYSILFTVLLGFLTAVHYMTNAFDGPIYILLTLFVFLYLYRLTSRFFINVVVLFLSFMFFSYPFSSHFTPFVSGIGVNCPPAYLANLGSFGPFLFEIGNCQISPIWMLFVLWGFFWISFALLLINRFYFKNWDKNTRSLDAFFILIFIFGIFLTMIPEFFYIKDIYPTHFRANTMFKLGYQAFIMMGIAASVVFFRLKQLGGIKAKLMTFVFMIFAFFVMIYPYFSVPSYYGDLDRTPNLDGASWMVNEYPEDREIIEYLNKYVTGQPTILEAQGDSYTDYERISSYTGLPTVAGWWVHEWLWRGSSDIIGDRIPDVEKMYKSIDTDETMFFLKKYGVEYVIISRLEREKYPDLNEEKFGKIGKLLFRSSDGFGALYQVNSSL